MLIDQCQCLRRTRFDASRTIRLVNTKVAFLCFSTLIGISQAMTCGLHCLGNDRHHAKRASDHAGFAADTFLLNNLNAVIQLNNGTIRAGAGTGGIFAMVTKDRSGTLVTFKNFHSRREIVRLIRELPFMVSDYTSNFAAPTTNTTFGVSNNKWIHLIFSQKSRRCRINNYYLQQLFTTLSTH